MCFRKNVMLGLTVLVIAGGWFSRTLAQEKKSVPVVTYFEHEKVDGSFAKNAQLFGGVSGGGKFKVLTARRDRPGEVEIHTLDTDIFYVVSGTATFVTGGKALETKTTAPDEIRGKSIEGGDPHHLSKGDVIFIPNGIPHWFKEVKAPFLYFVVKVR